MLRQNGAATNGRDKSNTKKISETTAPAVKTKKCMREKSVCPDTSPASNPNVLKVQIQGNMLRMMNAGPNGNKK